MMKEVRSRYCSVWDVSWQERVYSDGSGRLKVDGTTSELED